MSVKQRYEDSYIMDGHDMTVVEARIELLCLLDRVDDNINVIMVVHGHHGGTRILDMVRGIRHKRIAKICFNNSKNKGVTYIYLKHNKSLLDMKYN
jgi:hypothetical protein